MKVVLQEHVENLGERGQVVTVSPGYARNFLLPQKLALQATTANLKVVEQRRKIWEVKEAKEVGEAEQIAARLAEIELRVEKKAGETGTLYGAVTNFEIAELLAAKGVVVDRRKIVLGEPIKAVGEFDLPVKLHHKVTGQVKLHVESDQPPEAPEADPVTNLDEQPDPDADRDDEENDGPVLD